MRLFCAAVLGAAPAVLVAPAASASILSDWNLIVRGNVVSSSEIDGSSLIGGTLSGNSSNYGVQGATAPSGVGLAVAGGVTGGPKQVTSGSFRYTTAPTAIVNVASNNSAFDATIPAQVTAAMAQAVGISTTLATLTPNGTLDGAGNLNASPVLLSGQRVAVYSITPAQLVGLGQLNLNFGTADSVVINIATGGSISFVAPPNLVGGFSQANSSRIIWNLPNATSITVNNTFTGALLAPSADLQLIGGVFGTVVADSISRKDAEIRRSNYTGYIPAPGAASLLVGAGLLSTRRRRAGSPA